MPIGNLDQWQLTKKRNWSTKVKQAKTKIEFLNLSIFQAWGLFEFDVNGQAYKESGDMVSSHLRFRHISIFWLLMFHVETKFQNFWGIFDDPKKLFFGLNEIWSRCGEKKSVRSILIRKRKTGFVGFESNVANVENVANVANVGGIELVMRKPGNVSRVFWKGDNLRKMFFLECVFAWEKVCLLVLAQAMCACIYKRVWCRECVSKGLRGV